MWNGQQHPFGWVGDVVIEGRDPVLRDRNRAVANARVVDEEAAIKLVIWMEGEAQEATLTAGQDSRSNIEEHRRRRAAWLQHTDDARLLVDEEPVGAIAGMSDEYGAGETADDRHQLNGGEAWR